MASGDRHSVPPPSPAQPKSWAQVASSLRQPSDNSPLHNPHILSKLKENTSAFIKLDGDSLNRACLKFQHALYGKLFGKSPPFAEVKADLLAKWSSFGEISISDLPNGFLLIRCSSQKAMQSLLLDGPWSVNGIILQLSPWKPFFEPTFAKLSSAAIWIQLHNLPVEFWEGETLEAIANQFGTLLKVDEFTAALTRSKFARICVDVDLSKPLSRGFWIGDDHHRVFVIVLYERLPTFCYSCGLIGHGTNSCNSSATPGAARPNPSRPVWQTGTGSSLVSGVEDQQMDDSDPSPDAPPSALLDGKNSDTDYGPWLLVSRRRGNTRGRGGGARSIRTTNGVAADPSPEIVVPRGSAPRSLRGGRSFTLSGRPPTTHINPTVETAVSPDPTPIDPSVQRTAVISPLIFAPTPLSESQDETLLTSKVSPPSMTKSQDGTILASKASPPNLTTQITSFHPPPEKAERFIPRRQTSPPPTLRSSLQPPFTSSSHPNPCSHSDLVEKISAALEVEGMEADDCQDEDFSDEDDDDEMSEEEILPDSPDDDMTLAQYQTEARRDSLVRKGSNIPSSSPKKGRVEPGEIEPYS